MSDQTSPNDQSPDDTSGRTATPQDGGPAEDEAGGPDVSAASPEGWTAVAAPGKPDGEVDTRS